MRALLLLALAGLLTWDTLTARAVLSPLAIVLSVTAVTILVVVALVMDERAQRADGEG